MKKLQKYANIIPVIAKGDCYTFDEIKEIKLNIIKQAEENNLIWFDCIEVKLIKSFFSYILYYYIAS